MTEGKHSKTSIDIITGHKQAKKLQSRVTYVENGIKDVAETLLEYAAKSASIRHKMDDLAKSLAKFAQHEPYNTTTKLAMAASSEAISEAGDFRSSHVKKLEEKILPILSYESMCKKLREALKVANTANERECAKRRDVVKLNEKLIRPNNTLDSAEVELKRLNSESTKLTVAAHEKMIEFEQKRCRDMKQILLCFFKYEIAYLCHSLELFSDACCYVTSIDEDADIQAIQSALVLRGMQPLFDESHNTRSVKTRKKFSMAHQMKDKRDHQATTDLSKKPVSGIFDIIQHQQQRRKSKEIKRQTPETSQGSSSSSSDNLDQGTGEDDSGDNRRKKVSFDLKPAASNSSCSSSKRCNKDENAKVVSRHISRDVSTTVEENQKARTSATNYNRAS